MLSSTVFLGNLHSSLVRLVLLVFLIPFRALSVWYQCLLEISRINLTEDDTKCTFYWSTAGQRGFIWTTSHDADLRCTMACVFCLYAPHPWESLFDENWLLLNDYIMWDLDANQC